MYGSELWRLKTPHIIELEKIQNITVQIFQGLLPGTSGSAACGLLGLYSVETEIDKRKLYFVARLINMRPGLPCRRLFFTRLIRWKWENTNMVTEFIPDIIKLLEKYNLLDYMLQFLKTNQFPTKQNWKNIVKINWLSPTTTKKSGKTKLIKINN